MSSGFSIVDLPIFVEVLCDRCHRLIEGIRSGRGSSGFYEGPYWQRFMHEGETVLCDECMENSPEYRAQYSRVGKESA